MAFTGFGKPFVSAYRGLGKYGAGAAAGAALLAPAVFSSDERGYVRTAAITTPMIGAAFVAAPDVISGARQVKDEFGRFWSNKPFSKAGWKGFPDVARNMQAYGPHVRQAMKDVINRRQGAYYGGVPGYKPDVDSYVKSFDNVLTRMEEQESAYLSDVSKARGLYQLKKNGQIAELDFEKQITPLLDRFRIAERGFGRSGQAAFGSRRLVLSNALEEARRMTMTPDEMISQSTKSGVKPRSLAEIRQAFEANKGNETFMRVMSRRAQTADKVSRLSAAVSRNPSVHSSWAVAHLSPDAAIAELEMQKAGSAVTRAKAVQDAISRGRIGKDSHIVYAMQDGKRLDPIGAEIFHPFERRSFSLPFTNPSRSGVSMGSNWMHRGVAYSFWDEKGVHSPDDLILANLSNYDKAHEATQSAFSYSGVTDPLDPRDVAGHADLQNAVLSEEAIALRSTNTVPNPFGGFGANGSATFDKLNYEDQVNAVLTGVNKHGLTPMGPEGRLTEGRMQRGLRGIAVGQPPSMSIQDPNYRAWSKPGQMSWESKEGLRSSLVDADFYRDTLKVGEAGNMPGFVGEEGLITPQMKSLFGDIPAEAEAAMNSAYNRRSERNAFKAWKREYIEDYRARGGKEFLENDWLKEEWRNTDFKYFERQRREIANRWWTTKSGQTYAEHAHEILAKEIGNGALADDLVVKKAFGNYKQFLMEDPLRLSVRRLGRLGEKTALARPDLADRTFEITQLLDVDDLHLKSPKNGMGLDAGLVGFHKNRPVEVHKNSTLERFEQTEDGWKLWVKRKMPLSGAKADFGYGDKGGIIGMENFTEPMDLWNRQLEAINFIGRETGTGVILPRTTQLISEARVSSLKTKLPVSQLLEDSFQIASDMISGSYSAEAAARSERFLDDLAANHLFHRTARGVAERTNDVLALSDYDQVLRSNRIARSAESYLNEVGQMGAASGTEYPLFRAFRTASKVRAGAGRDALSMTDWMNRTFRFANVKPWAHDLLNVQKEVHITYDMLNELARTGSHEAIGAVYGNIDWTHGDPARAAAVVEHLKGGQFDSKAIGNVLHKDAIAKYSGKDLDARTGNSVFNPFNEAVQENYSIDLGAVLEDVEVAGVKTKLRYAPSLGMKAYKGSPDKYDGGWAWTELEKKKARMLQVTQDIDWSRAAKDGDQAKLARNAVSEYMNELIEQTAGNKGVLRAVGVYRNAAAGYTAHLSGGPEVSPFDIAVPHNVYARQSEAMQAQLTGEGVYGLAFRNPVSAGYQVRYRYSELSHLEPNQFGIHPALSGPYQLDHDEDPFIAMFYGQSEQEKRASKAAAAAIADPDSAQSKNLKTSSMFQAMEDSHNITYEMFEKEAGKKGPFGEKSYLTELVNAVEKDQNGVAKLRERVLRGRFTFGETGAYSNLSTKLQLMLSNNPQFQPGDWDFQMMNRLAQYTRQVPISSSKGKMDLGSNPEQLRRRLSRSLSRGEGGVAEAHELFTQIAGGVDFDGLYSKQFGEITGITNELLKENGKVVFKDGVAQFGKKAYNVGEKFNAAEHFAASQMGRDTIAKMMTGHDVRKVNVLSDMLVKKKLSAEDAMRMWHSGIEEMSPEITAMYRKGASSESALGRAAKAVFGEQGSRMADEVSDMLGAINESVKSAGGSMKTPLKAAGMAAAIGLGVAAVAGLATTAVSSNKHRPEENVGVTDRVPGEPIAGVRSSVNPKRRLLPAVQGVKTMVVSRMQQSRDLEVRAKASDQSAQHEVAKMAEKMAEGKGYSNITVNRVGGWQQTASKMRVRNQIRDELSRY